MHLRYIQRDVQLNKRQRLWRNINGVNRFRFRFSDYVKSDHIIVQRFWRVGVYMKIQKTMNHQYNT